MDVLDLVELLGSNLSELGFNFKLTPNLAKTNTYLKIWKITDKEKQFYEERAKKAQRDVNEWIQRRKVYKEFFGQSNDFVQDVAGGEKPT